MTTADTTGALQPIKTRALIHVPRSLVRECAQSLESRRGWRKRPLRALIGLIYCLNTIADQRELVPYQRGFRQPAQAVRGLKGLQTLCRRAAGTGNASPLLHRLGRLRDEDTDVFHLLAYAAAKAIDPKRPQLVEKDAAWARLDEIACRNPGWVADQCAALISPLKEQLKAGRGGSRHQRHLENRFVVESLGHYWEWLTGKRPGVTFIDSGAAARDRYTGPFIELCRTVLAHFGPTPSGRQVFKLLQTLEVDYWRPAAPRRPWAGPRV